MNIHHYPNPIPELPVDGGEVVTKIVYEPYANMYLEGHPFPLKGNPTQQSIIAINIIKKLLPFWWVPSLKKAAIMALRPHVLNKERMVPAARELRDIFGENDLSYIISHVIEYDSAYRVRLQFMLTAGRSPLKMLRYNKRQDYPGAHRKIRIALGLLALWLLVPSHLHRWLSADLQNLLPDEADRYWFERRTDYGPNNNYIKDKAAGTYEQKQRQKGARIQ